MDKPTVLTDKEKLEREKNVFKRIHENTITALGTVGLKINKPWEVKDIINSLEKNPTNGIIFDPTDNRLHFVNPEYILECLEITPKDFEGRPERGSMGIGGTPGFLWREKGHSLPATLVEFKHLVDEIAEYPDIIEVCSIPVKTAGKTDFVAATILDTLSCLKIVNGWRLRDDEIGWFSKNPKWFDSYCITMSYFPLTIDEGMLKAMVRSVMAGNNQKITIMSFARISGPPEILLTISHMEYLCTNIIIQTLKPKTPCIYGVMPGATNKKDRMLNYSSPIQNLINASVSRLAKQELGILSIQSGASTSGGYSEASIAEGREGRTFFRRVGFDALYHCFGNTENLKYLHPEKREKECQWERFDRNQKQFTSKVPPPLNFPEDPCALEVIERVQGGDYWNDKAMLKEENLFCWENWEESTKHLFEN